MSAQFAVPAECPKCRHKESWSVWIGESGYPMGKCHRAQCSYLGRLEGHVFITPKKREPRYYTRPTAAFVQQLAVIERLYGIVPQEAEVTYSAEDDRFVLPVYGPVGHNKRGVVAYSLSGGEPKTKVYNEKPDEPFVHYAQLPTMAAEANLVVVEDWFSAEKVSTTAYGVGVALMGTNLPQAAVTEIADLAATRNAKVWLAFDQDAYEKSLNYLFKYREQFPGGLFAWRLKQDLKYETSKRITEALVDGRTNFFDRTTAAGGNDGGSKSL